MSASHHIIRRYTFDVQFSAKAKALALQDSISSLFRRRLAADMDELLQQLLPEDMVAVLDTLELDLGTVLYKDMETQLPLKLLEALEKALTGILRTGTPGLQHQLSGKVVVKTGSERLCELLEYYLLTGAMPWWATAAEREQPDQAIFQLSTNAPALLAALVRKLGQQQYVRKRIAWQFSIAAIQQIVSVLEPAEAAFIFEYSREVLQIQQRQQVLQTESKALERAVWLFVLSYLVTDAGSNFNRKQFVRSHLTQMAHHFNVDYDTLLQLFYDALIFYRQEIQTATIGDFIKTLYSENHPGGDIRSRDFSPRKHYEQATDHIVLLRYYLQFGSFPWWAEPASLAVLYDALLLSARQSPAPLKEMLTLTLQQEAAWKRWTTLFEPARRTAVIMQLNDNWLLQANEQFFARPSAVAGMAPGTASSEDPAHILLRDVILYRLLYGSIPWWGKTYAYFSVHSLLQQLMEQSVTEAVMVFKYAGTFAYTVERFLSGITSDQFFAIARASGVTDMARNAYEQVYALLQFVHRYMISGVKIAVLQQQVMKAFWRVWADAGYGPFSITSFTEEALRYWAEAAGFTPGSLVVLMKNALPAIIAATEEVHYQWLMNHLQQLVTVWQTEGAALYHAFVSGRAPDVSQHPHPLIHFVRNNRAPATPEEKELSASTITGWLRHFLEEGRLPSQAGSFITEETIWLGTRMLEWLYVNYKEKLADIRAVIQPLPAMLNRLYSLWQVSTTLAPVRELLMYWMEHVLAPPEAGTMVVMDGLWQELPEQGKTSVREQRSTLPAAVSRLMHRFGRYDTITSSTEKQEWLEQAMGLLTYFLAHKRLPDHLYGIEGATVHALLKQSVILLFREKPAALTALFSDSKGQLSARMEIYQVFTPPTGGLQENSIRQSLEAYAIEDSLLMLQETVTPSIKSAVSSFRDAVYFYKQQGRQERQLFYKRIFHYPVLVQYAAQQLDDDTFLEMMEDIEIGWGHPATAALRELQQLFDRMITDSGEREKLRVLFRQFHIMLLTGQFTLPNATAYAGRFLEFVMNNGAGIARNFIEQLVEVN
ncbi:MAG TPA: contractile injection system tape measure protein, partial [Chitinophaga sp.]